MGKEVTFQANVPSLHEVNQFVHDQHLKFFRIEPSRTQKWLAEEYALLDIDQLCANRLHGSYYLVMESEKLPLDKEHLIDFVLDKSRHIELALFMDNPQYDSRIWFQTGDHLLEKEANALLRKVRSTLAKSGETQELINSVKS